MPRPFELTKGDRIEIKCQGWTLTGTVRTAEFSGGYWYIQYDHDTNGYAYWKQDQDGGTVRKL